MKDKKSSAENGIRHPTGIILPPGLVFPNPEPRPVIFVGDIGSRNIKFAMFRKGDPFSILKGDKAVFLAKGGRENIEKTGEELERRRDIMDVIGDARLFITEAGRHMSADDIQYLEQKAGRRIRVLSGEEEANYNRIAILAEIKYTKDVQTHTEMFASIGGGSLQLGYLNEGDASLASIPQGIQYLLRNSRRDIIRGAHQLQEALKPLPYEAHVLRAAGGVWREMGKLIDTHGHIENYESTAHRPISVPRKDMLRELKYFRNIGPESLHDIGGGRQRMHEEVVFSAMALYEIIQHYDVREIYISHATTRQAAALDDHFYDFMQPAAQRSSAPGRSGPARPALG